MKPNQIFIFLSLVSFTLQAQLKVINNASIYVNDNFSYVTDDVHLYDLNDPRGWISAGSTATLNSGEGFTMKGTSGSDNVVQFSGATQNRILSGTTLTASGDQRYDFRGIPNDGNISIPMISDEPTPHIKINTLLNNQAVRQIAMIFMDNALDGYDPADTESADIGNLPYDMYFYLANSEFIHDARKFNINNKYAIGFKCNTAAVFRMKAVEIVNFDQAQNVYLHDKLTDEYFNIKNSDVTINLPAGVNNTRYELTLTNNTLETYNNFKNNFDIYQDNCNSLLTIRNPDLVNISNIKLFDIQGKLIFEKKDLEVNSLYQFNTNSLNQGIYIVKMITKSNQEITKKTAIIDQK
ncbi:MAG: T9SS type A sorting domain-containing protein [Limnohabitans sp.]|nr:T9SS type A sorting domain-containing protein [Limnohabitans sp.]